MKTREFINIYFKKLPECKTYEQAYEQAEKEHKALTGKRMYKNYKTFKSTLSQQKQKS